mgnify:CR=1 FL=1
MKTKQNIKIEGYSGKWSAIDNYDKYYLMENDYYGDETCYLVIDDTNTVISETYDDIVTALEDEGLI